MAVLVTYTFSLDRGISIKLRIGLRVGIASIVGEVAAGIFSLLSEVYDQVFGDSHL
jgi:hypothetical protein